MLHAFAERVGRNVVVPLQLDEVREMELLVRSFPVGLPCPACQQHSREYIQTHPLGWAKLRGADIAPALRQWLYDFHDHVNKSKAEPTVSPAFESIEAYYKGVLGLGIEERIIGDELKRALTFNWVKREAALKFKRHLECLRRLTGL
jgi:hypothetical protein